MTSVIKTGNEIISTIIDLASSRLSTTNNNVHTQKQDDHETKNINANNSCTNKDDCSEVEQLSMHRVGFWWSDKKSQKLNINELTVLFAEHNCEFVKLNLERPLDEQGPFSVIVHKLSDIMVKAELGDTIAKKAINAFENYARKHPEVVVMDPLEHNRILLDRYKQYRLIDQSGLTKDGLVFTPSFVHLTSTNLDVNRGRIKRSRLTFPVVCKPILAQGSTGAHQMCIIFNEAGLKDVKPPCVAQSFVNHNAKLFKLFVIKDKYFVKERPSLKNFNAGDFETVFFFSHDISKPNSSSSLTELDDFDDAENYETNDSKENNQNLQFVKKNQLPIKPCPKLIKKVVDVLSKKLSLTFFGIDIIIENGTQRYAIIDMNTFPGYDGVESFSTIFRDVISDAIPKHDDATTLLLTNQTIKAKRKPTEIDSGIESA